MGAVYFYQLTSSPLEATLPMLVNKARGAGWRVLVRGSDPAQIARLDQLLWLGDPAGFLPHGVEGGAHDAMQPVLLGVDTAADAFACIMSVGGAPVTDAEVKTAQRCCVLFDGADEAALNAARGQWKSLTAAGCEAQYWAQEDGAWTKKASSG